jgi:L-alanine-DL-glutamate epimerase-like enolase superfamily enzyme
MDPIQIASQDAQYSLWKLLGGKVRDAVPLYAHGGGASMDACVDSVKR